MGRGKGLPSQACKHPVRREATKPGMVQLFPANLLCQCFSLMTYRPLLAQLWAPLHPALPVLLPHISIPRVSSQPRAEKAPQTVTICFSTCCLHHVAFRKH